MQPTRSVPTVHDVQTLRSRGPRGPGSYWSTKSGGKLNVKFAIPRTNLDACYFHYDPTELARVPSDIRGLRLYTVSELPRGSVGGTEWHRIREEMVFCLRGSVLWTCEDLVGQTRRFRLNRDAGIWMPPFILHTYEAEEGGSELMVIANTLFDPDDDKTHDTYPMEEFRALQAEYRADRS